jgi:rhodanese-related sulfurtransferase
VTQGLDVLDQIFKMRELAVWLWPAAGLNPLTKIERRLALAFDDVPVVEPHALAACSVTDFPNVLLFDMRSPAEFAVSHIHGAIRVDAAIGPAAFASLHGARVRGRRVVFYCAIGLRSGRAARNLKIAIESAGGVLGGNLSGGLFRWRNEGLSLTGPNGPTRSIHPYNRHWARFLLRHPQP